MLRIRFRLQVLVLSPSFFPQENGLLTEQVIRFLNYSEKVPLFLCLLVEVLCFIHPLETQGLV